ncbi:TlpA family protein disulfide reductase [bacterium]|nr:MAG: TlpA family protein disulfide reductase [bacterium]
MRAVTFPMACARIRRRFGATLVACVCGDRPSAYRRVMLAPVNRRIWIAIAAGVVLAGCGGGGKAASSAGPGSLAGAPVESFTVARLGGGNAGVTDFHGKVLLVNLWASWCPPCRQEMPDLERFSRNAAKDGVEVVGVNEGESAQTAAAFAKTVGVTFPILLDQEQRYGAAYGALGLPTTVFVRRDGTVSEAVDGPLTYDQMQAKAKRAEGTR